MTMNEWEAALEMGDAADTASARTLPNWKVADLIRLARTDALTTAQAEAASLRAEVEALGEALHGLSAMLLLTNALEDDKTHAAYEKVVARFAALTERSQ